ncbi:MAG: alpha/beta fold hydrolase [Alphaproteobacteria bacterium]|nr:alpha/beta fold hydrolase [Alphaproteobacteria bacterium]MDD9920204.1 alpha/beta fold hydrolase [Alphaproteobacteria bacterium]
MNHDKFRINKKSYDWYMRLMRIVKDRLHVNLKVHNNIHLLNEGQIFLFNHFARFETAVPPYLIYEETGKHCRAIAHHELFNVSEGLTKFLIDMGAVPNNMPGLLPFMAAEILRGQKVMIFPEGRIVKDRHVLNKDGRYHIFSESRNDFKEVHRGAAALALTLDMFKRRIRTRFEEGDTLRIEHWCKALEIDDPQELLRQASKPTLIVPSTITFYPLRTDDNFLSRSVSFFAKNLPDTALEELIIEGNILLKDTDMDIHVGDAIELKHSWPWWQRWLLNSFFETQVHELNDLFDLHKHATTWQEKMLLGKIQQETDAIRQAYSHSIYTGVMVNFGHLASTLIIALLDSGIKSASRRYFQRVLYLALKNLQKSRDVKLHRSLHWPDRYRGILDGSNEELMHFVQECSRVGLMDEDEENYIFLDKLEVEQAQGTIRRENPITVYANEVAHVTAVKQAVEKAIGEEESVKPSILAGYQFDDEKRNFELNRRYFDEKHVKLKSNFGKIEDGAPYFYLPHIATTSQAQTGILLVHGFTSSPSELKDFGRHLHHLGYTVMGARLSGHGTSPYDLAQRTKAEWMASVRRSYHILASYVDRVVVVGFSTGGTLALKLASEQPDKLAGLACVSAAIKVQDRNMHFLPFLQTVNKVAGIVPGLSSFISFYGEETSQPGVNYDTMPIKALNELRLLIQDVKNILSNVVVPTVVLQGDQDETVHPRSAQKIYDTLGSDDKVLHWVKDGPHALIKDNVGLTWPTLEKFIAGFSQKEEKGEND